MAYLLDTSILVRLANAADSQHAVAANAVLQLHRCGESLHLTAQVLVEFRSVATRPVTHNGLGLSIQSVEAQATGFEAAFPLLPETPDIYPTWKTVVSDNSVTGKQVHDARLVAVCYVHRVTHLLTFNVAHFTRMAASASILSVVDPAMV